jgi:hypothetical protein
MEHYTINGVTCYTKHGVTYFCKSEGGPVYTGNLNGPPICSGLGDQGEPLSANEHTLKAVIDAEIAKKTGIRVDFAHCKLYRRNVSWGK